MRKVCEDFETDLIGFTVMALCSTLSLALLMVVGTARLPGNPLPDAWSGAEVREALPQDDVKLLNSILGLAGPSSYGPRSQCGCRDYPPAMSRRYPWSMVC